jgi:membrane-bound serine protease (ClpP class)
LLLVAGFVAFLVLDAPWGVVLLVAAAVVEVGEFYFWIRFLRRYRVQTGAEALRGEVAEVVDDCHPTGRVKLRGELWNAVCEEGADRGERVSVTAVDGLTLRVERAG